MKASVFFARQAAGHPPGGPTGSLWGKFEALEIYSQ